MTLLSSSRDCPDCGSDHKSKPYCVYTNGTFCFACGVKKTTDRNYTNIRKLKSSVNVQLPELTTNPVDFSLKSLQWLYQYYVYENLISLYQIAEAEGPSLVFPVFNESELGMYQRRWLTDRTITTSGPKQFLRSQTPECGIIVIVEDFISCIRVGEVLPCICLFGTNLPYSEQVKLVSSYSNILVWLDGDAPGQTAAAKIIASLRKVASHYMKHNAFAVREPRTISNILTEKDPKCYSPSKIQQILGENHPTSDKYSRIDY